MTLQVRPAVLTDAAGMIAVLAPIIAAGGWTAMTRTPSLAEQEAFILGFQMGGVCLVALNGERIVGMQDAMPVGARVGDIRTFVALDQHRAGVGRSLTAAMLPLAKAAGIDTLRAKILPSNPTSLAFYYGMDFRRASGGWPAVTIAERSTDVLSLTSLQERVCAIFESRVLEVSPKADASDAEARFGADALEAARSIRHAAIHAPVDWSKQGMDDGLAVLANMLRERYPWLSVKARSALTGAFVMNWK